RATTAGSFRMGKVLWRPSSWYGGGTCICQQGAHRSPQGIPAFPLRVGKLGQRLGGSGAGQIRVGPPACQLCADLAGTRTGGRLVWPTPLSQTRSEPVAGLSAEFGPRGCIRGRLVLSLAAAGAGRSAGGGEMASRARCFGAPKARSERLLPQARR